MSIGVLTEMKIVKDRQEVELVLSTGNGMKGYFFLAKGQRPLDMLNDSRKFIPFEDVSGSVRLVNKECIVSVKPTGNVSTVDA